jgi:hypothetical protein
VSLTPLRPGRSRVAGSITCPLPGFRRSLISSVSMSAPVVLKRPVAVGKECRELPESISRLCHTSTATVLHVWRIYAIIELRGACSTPFAACFDTMPRHPATLKALAPAGAFLCAKLQKSASEVFADLDALTRCETQSPAKTWEAKAWSGGQ